MLSTFIFDWSETIKLNKAGVYAIGITTGYHTRDRLKKEKPDKIIDSLSELLE